MKDIKNLKMQILSFKIFNVFCLIAFILLTTTQKGIAAIDESSFFTNFENAQLLDQNNKRFNIEALQGKLVLFNFIFTQCSTVCSIQTKQLAQLRKTISPELSKNVVFISVTLDPLTDNPKKLKKFAERMHLDETNWYFLTGKQETIADIVNRLALLDDLNSAKSANNLENHKTNLWLTNQRGLLVIQYHGVPVDIERLTRELKQLNEMQPS